MSESKLHPLEEILFAIHRAAPQAWHYRASGYDPEGVEQILELLHLEGLITRGTSSASEGPGVVLTPQGEEVVRDPEALARLRNGEPINPTDPGAIVRSSLRNWGKPVLTRLIILSNVLVFAWCAYLASLHQGLLSAYLAPSLRISARVGAFVLDPAGSLSGVDLLQGQWWRMLACCFVHAGTIHLLMNMYTLNGCGRFVEQTWGRWRYGLIYLFSAWGGSCLAMALAPMQGVVGASGAICGVLAAEGVWVVLNGKYLPRAMARRGRNQLVTTIVLMVFISLLPGISGYGHLGGAIAGAIAAVALNVQRFGVGPVRILAWPVLIAIPLVSYWHLDSRMKTKEWENRVAGLMERKVNADRERQAIVETEQFNLDCVRPMRKSMQPAIEDYNQKVNNVRDKHPDRRDPEEVQAAIATLDKHLASLETLIANLKKSGPYHDPDVVEARTNAIDYAQQRAEVFREARRCLEVGKKWTRADEAAFDAKWQTMLRLRQEWQERLK